VVTDTTQSVHYHWLKDGNILWSAPDNPTLTLANVQKANAGNYSVIVGNAAGTVISQEAQLAVQ
jgi:hypothetical protein